MSKTYKNGLLKKKSVQKSKNPYLYGKIPTSGNTAVYANFDEIKNVTIFQVNIDTLNIDTRQDYRYRFAFFFQSAFTARDY